MAPSEEESKALRKFDHCTRNHDAATIARIKNNQLQPADLESVSIVGAREVWFRYLKLTDGVINAGDPSKQLHMPA